MMNSNVIAIDLAKNIFHLFSYDANERVVKMKMKRANLLAFIAQQPPSLIGLEACGGSNYWAREFKKLGHEVILLQARFVKSFVMGNKNDFNDAEAIHTAATRPNKRTVAIKTIGQQEVQILHRIRQDAVWHRTAQSNRIRGFLSEFGIVLPESINVIRKQLPDILEDGENQLGSLGRTLLKEIYDQLIRLDEEIKEHDKRIGRLSQQNNLAKRFMSVPGIGPITATIIASDLGESSHYETGRDYAASLGIVPRQHSSGDKQVLLGISKRGNRYIRTLLIHGARAVLKNCKSKTDPLSQWLQALIERRGFNKAAVALANKNARILWAMAKKKQEFGEHLKDEVVAVA